MDQTIDDYDAIVATVQHYVTGTAQGNREELLEAFHEDARIFGQVEGQRLDLPIEEFYTLAEKWPADADGTYTIRVLSVDQVQDAAVVVVAEEGVWGEVSIIDFFSLVRLKGEWKIVCKVFTHTSGTMPIE
ncbi:MAG TPA: nuclear transport factor 2 family protein [Acidimicrobiales bacterium]|nr:nuclear transport factor 2 family protein [Acidimicrobiales bacterium]